MNVNPTADSPTRKLSRPASSNTNFGPTAMTSGRLRARPGQCSARSCRVAAELSLRPTGIRPSDENAPSFRPCSATQRSGRAHRGRMAARSSITTTRSARESPTTTFRHCGYACPLNDPLSRSAIRTRNTARLLHPDVVGCGDHPAGAQLCLGRSTSIPPLGGTPDRTCPTMSRSTGACSSPVPRFRSWRSASAR